MLAFPLDNDELSAALMRRPPEVVRQWAVFACEEALGVWERRAAKLKMEYRDSVVGLKHDIDRALPRRTLVALSTRAGDLAALSKEWMEPITALQDDDWSLPDAARFAFYSCYNALVGAERDVESFATAIHFARDAMFVDFDEDRARFDPIWSRWWQRCLSVSDLEKVDGRLPRAFECETFIDFATAVYQALGVPLGQCQVEERSLPPQSYEVEAVKSTRWSDGTHTVELVRTWDRPVPMESRDRGFDAWMLVPEFRATLSFRGMDDFEHYTLSADRDELARVQAAVHRAAVAFVSRTARWTNLLLAPDDWLAQAQRARLDVAPCKDPLLAQRPWIVTEVDGRPFAIEARAWSSVDFAPGDPKGTELETIGPLPGVTATAIPEGLLDPLDPRKVFAAVTRLSVGEPEQVVNEANATSVRHRGGGFVVRRRSRSMHGELFRDFIAVQSESPGGVAVFLYRESRTSGLVVGEPAGAAEVRDRLLCALGAEQFAGQCPTRQEPGSTALFNAAERGQLADVRARLRLGDELEVFDRWGRTPLMLAARGGHYEVIEALLAAGALVDVRDSSRRTALMATHASRQPRSIGILVGAGARIDARDVRGWTPLHFMAECGSQDLVTALLDVGAPLDARDFEGNTPLLLAAPKSYGVADYTDGTEDAGRNETRHLGAIVALVKRGADVRVRNANGETALARAEAAGNRGIAKYLRESGAA